MFNSNLSSSITGWFSQLSSPEEKPKENHEEKSEEGEKNAEEGSDGSSKSRDEGGKTEVLSSEMQKKVADETQKLMSSALSFGNYLFEVASETTKIVSTNLNETASNLKKTVETKTILGDLNREQDEFIRTKREKQGDGAVPAWYGYQEEEVMKEQILALSTDSRNFLRSPPNGVQFQFDMDHYFPVALATLKEDKNLRQMRFNLVPTKVKEENFWRNYFYRVSLIKQSAQLSTLAETQKLSDTSSSSTASSIVVVGSTAVGTIPTPISDNNSQSSTPNLKDDVITDEHVADGDDIHGAEFESDAFESTGSLNAEDLEREMRELGMDDSSGADPATASATGANVAVTSSTSEWDVPVWEKEIQKALQAYEVVSEEKDESWDEEIEEMLTAEDAEVTNKTD